MNLPEIGKAVLEHRKMRGMTQRELAESAGVSRYTLIKLEKGKASDIQLKTALAILSELNLTLEVRERPVTGLPVLGEKP